MRSNRTQWLFCILALGAGSAAIAGDALTLVRDGQARCAILVDDGASPSERFGVEELQSLVKEMSGAELPAFSPEKLPADLKPETFVIVGLKAARKRVPALKLDGLGDEGFVIATEGRDLIVAGGEKRGTLYGAYALLERLGCRWWTPTESTIPKAKTLEIGPLNVREAPRFEYRDIMFLDMIVPGPGEKGTLWSVRNRLNGPNYKKASEKQGGMFSADGSLIHSYGGLLSRARSVKYDENQEMWGLYQGKRNRAQPCLMNPDVEKAMVESVQEKLRQRPDIAFVTVGQNDGEEHCECGKCKALSDAEGTAGAPVIDLANRVAEKVAKEFPNAIINASAYAWSRKPPAKLKPRDNVMVSLASIETDFGHPLATAQSEANAKFREDIEGWSRIAKRLYIWDYSTNFGCWLFPWPNLDVIAPNVKFYADHKVAGYFVQGSHTGRMTEFSPLRMWVLARAMWNPDADGKALTDEFLNGYYGPAAGPIRKYIAAIHKPVRDNPQLHLPCGLSSKLEDAPWLAPDVIAEAEVHLREAEKKVEGDPVLARRVRHAHMPVWYLLVKRDLLLAKSGQKSPLRLAVEAKAGGLDFADVALSFVRAAKENAVNSDGEHKELAPWSDWLADYVKAVKEKGRVVPPELEKEDPKKCFLFQGCMAWVPPPHHGWYKAQLKGAPLGFRKAPEASDGWVVETGTTLWFVRYEFKAARDFVSGRKYKLFVRVNSLLKDKEGPGFGCGIGRKAAPLAKWFNARDLADGKFQTLEVGELAMDEDGGNFWIALAKDSALSKVSLDCFWLVEAP